MLCPQDVGIILSYRCHSGCKHCIYNCGPAWAKEPMSSEALCEALEAVLIWPKTPQVHLTGGEPFLHFPLLLEGVQAATELGIFVYVETSGAWCTDEGEAVERFAALREAGLQAVLVSCSPFHAERIPPVRTLRTVHAAVKVFGPRRVTVYMSEFLEIVQRFSEDGDIERPVPLSRYERELGVEGARRVLWEGYSVVSGGRAGYQLGHFVPRHPAEVFAQASCVGELVYAQHSHFDLYGNFIPAWCGGLTIGDWRALPQILDDFEEEQYPSLVKVLVERGPYGLYQMAQEQYDYQPLAEGYTGRCHLCVDVRRHLVEVGDLAELRPRGFYMHI